MTEQSNDASERIFRITAVESIAGSPKKVYAPPVLDCLGDVRDITLAATPDPAYEESGPGDAKKPAT